MDDEVRSGGVAPDLAGAGHVTEGSRDEEVGPGDGEDGDDSRGEGAIGPVEGSSGQEALDPDCLDSDQLAQSMVMTSWMGLLPPPDDFLRYPEEVQAKIVEMAERSQASRQEIAERAMRLDEAESRRLDKVVETDSKQVPRAQWGTIAINLSIAGLMAYALCLGQASAFAGLTSVWAVINAASLFISWHGSRKS